MDKRAKHVQNIITKKKLQKSSWQEILFRYCQPVASPTTIKITPQYKGRKICKGNNSTIPSLAEKYAGEITLQYQGWQKNM